MAQLTIREFIEQAARFGIHPIAGPIDDRAVQRAAVVQLDQLSTVDAGTLVIVAGDDSPAPYRVDVALRQASARGLAGIVFATRIALAETAVALAERGGVPVLSADTTAAELAVVIDRLLSSGESESMLRVGDAIDAAAAAAARSETPEQILTAASAVLGSSLTLVEDPTATWSDTDAVCVGEVVIGRVAASTLDAATAVALPVITSLVSRAAQRQLRDRFAGAQSRASLIVELVLAESSRVEAFLGQATRLGFAMQQSHVVAWLTVTGVLDRDAQAPRHVQPALELFTLQLVEGRDETWHVATLHDSLLLVSTEQHGAADHQRRVREIATQVQSQARALAGSDWQYTLGLGTPQVGAVGLRLSAAEARIAAESAVAADRLGGVELTDVTGLSRVLLDFFASPISRTLLADVLQPLDDLGPERASTAVTTLLAYLSHRNSLLHAGRELHLHPNAVAYRLKRIREALQLDLDDPDTRFALELACRVRLLGASARRV